MRLISPLEEGNKLRNKDLSVEFATRAPNIVSLPLYDYSYLQAPPPPTCYVFLKTIFPISAQAAFISAQCMSTNIPTRYPFTSLDLV